MLSEQESIESLVFKLRNAANLAGQKLAYQVSGTMHPDDVRAAEAEEKAAENALLAEVRRLRKINEEQAEKLRSVELRVGFAHDAFQDREDAGHGATKPRKRY